MNNLKNRQKTKETYNKETAFKLTREGQDKSLNKTFLVWWHTKNITTYMQP